MYKERFKKLVLAVKEAGGPYMDDDLDTIVRDMDSFIDYVRSVFTMEVLLPVICARYEGQEVRDRISALDTSRRNKHERAIVAISKLERMCDDFGVPVLFEGNKEDRYEVADFCLAIVTEFFEDGQHPLEETLKSADFKDVVNDSEGDA